jgi:hypothetical protein
MGFFQSEDTHAVLTKAASRSLEKEMFWSLGLEILSVASCGHLLYSEQEWSAQPDITPGPGEDCRRSREGLTKTLPVVKIQKILRRKLVQLLCSERWGVQILIRSVESLIQH